MNCNRLVMTPGFPVELHIHSMFETGECYGPGVKRVLNVGGNSKDIPLAPEYTGWEHVLLDIDPRGNPDVVCDARELAGLPGGTYDAVYCSHNLEHYYHHEVPKVLKGFAHVLEEGGFAEIIRVPDIASLMKIMVEKNLDIGDVLYESPAGPITVRDVLYGYGVEIERSGNDFFCAQNRLYAQLVEDSDEPVRIHLCLPLVRPARNTGGRLHRQTRRCRNSTLFNLPKDNLADFEYRADAD